MGKKKYTTRKQRQANNGKIEQTQRFENNAQGITASLEHMKNQNRYITSAIEEISTVSSGNGLMPDQMPKITEKEHLSFVDSIFGKALEGFGDKLVFEKFYTYGRGYYASVNRFKVVDSATDNRISVTNNGNSDKWYLKTTQIYGLGISEVSHKSKKYMRNTPEYKFFKFIAQCINYDINPPGSIKTVDCNSFSKAEFIEYLKQLINHPRYRYYYSNYISQASRNIPEASEMHIPFKCSSLTISSSSTAATTALGLTTFLTTTLLPIINITTPTISYNNSTNTSIIDTNYNTTTSKPEQGDSIDKGYAVVIGASVIMSIMFFCFIGRYCWKKAPPSGEYNVHKEECLMNSESNGYVKYENVDYDANNRTTLSTIKEETASLLSNNEQSTTPAYQAPTPPHEPSATLSIDDSRTHGVQHVNTR